MRNIRLICRRLKAHLRASLVSTLALASLAADAPDSRALEGSWVPLSAELAGQPFPEAVLKTIRLKLHHGGYEVSVGGHPDKGTYTVDASTTPKRLTITGTEGPNTGKTFPAIYAIEGDTLRICYDLSGKKTPEEFKTVAGTRLYLVTYTRRKE